MRGSMHIAEPNRWSYRIEVVALHARGSQMVSALLSTPCKR